MLPDGRGSAIAGVYLNLLGHAVGWPSPRGGAGQLTDALVARLESLGGSVRTQARVTRVHARGGRVSGVELAGGERMRADVVIADVSPRALLAMAGEHFGRRYRTALRAFRPGASTIKVDWALDGPIPWESDETRRAGTVHVAGTEAELLDAVTTARSRLPDRPFLLARPADGRRPDPRTRGQAHRLGLHPWAGGLDRLPRARRAHGGAGGALRSRLPRPDPRPPRDGRAPSSSAATRT